MGPSPRRVVGALGLIGAVVLALASPASEARTSPAAAIDGCALGADVPGLTGYYAGAVQQAASSYAARYASDPSTQAKAADAFTAAAAAYVYGLPQVSVRSTVKHFPRNVMVSVDALAGPQVTTVVAPNVDTAYSTAWIDLTSGPIVVNVPDTGGRFYTFQFLDAFTNAFAYVGSGSTGTRAGAYALVPPGWSGSLPAGVTRIDSPSNTVWLLGRTLVDGPSDLPAVNRIQQQYKVTPLSAWETGARQPPVVTTQYPPTIPKSIPSGAQFIATLNDEMNVDPPPAADDCALQAMAPAGVRVPHPSSAQTLLSDLSDEAPPLPSVASDPVTDAALTAGTNTAAKIIAGGEDRLDASSRRVNNGWNILGGWVGDYGIRYLGRSIVATVLLAANTPAQTIYPIADTDVTGRTLSGAYRYTVRFPRGDLPPVRAFWSLTMYDSSLFLYANQINRYAVGDRTRGLHFARDGSLTFYIQHDQPGSADERANWLPAPSGQFHLILRLYQPGSAALTGRWKPAPVVRDGTASSGTRPRLSGLRISPRSFHPAGRHARRPHGPARVSYRDSEAVVTHFTVVELRRRPHCHARRGHSCTVSRTVARFTHRDRAGVNRMEFSGRVHGHALRRRSFLLRAVAGGSGGVPRSRVVSVRFRIL